MSDYRPPKEGENDAEFWQRLREMAELMKDTAEDGDPDEDGQRHTPPRDRVVWPDRRGHRRINEPKVGIIDLSKYIDGAG